MAKNENHKQHNGAAKSNALSTRVKGKKGTYKYVAKPFYPGVPRQEGFTLEIPPEIFIFAHKALLAAKGNEIAGFAAIDESNRINWVWRDVEALMSAGNVKSSQGRGMAAASIAGKEIKIQWHTHPSFSTSWSGVDTGDQEEMINDLMIGVPNGNFTFLVFNTKAWRLRRIHWANRRVVRIQDGFATLDGLLLDEPVYVSRVYTTAKSYGGAQPDDEADDWHWGLYGSKYYGDWDIDPQDEDDIFYDPYIYMGSWSKDEEDYRPLFNHFGIAFGVWPSLEQAIERQYPRMAYAYDLIIEAPDSWHELPPPKEPEVAFGR